MKTDQFHIHLLDWHAAKPLVLPLRTKVFVIEQNVPIEIEQDAFDPICTHAAAQLSSGETIATGRLRQDGTSGYVGRMAVASNWRGEGVGGKIIKSLIKVATERHITHLYLHAQVRAMGFYQRYGFKPHGETFIEAGIPHQAMEQILRPE